ncbi:DUF4139 domain-containing protein [Ruegeria pomeroyi]|nr:DUF4139 domain-containing protein [Ruegeria pomeroyi]NVK97980.1 DUF4139 domain-containing protein [Ruegeria pomeroyi]NVL02419.1 DUF4139 domain-containing protein [Ruegeria pomeroyi]QWV10464.1 DUF4139 domain-containing protein [Ruegeria pomeroyi]
MRFFVPFVVALFSTVTPGLAGSYSTETTVTAATVFPQGAAVRRQLSMELPAGRHDLTLLGIPVDGPELETLDIQVAGARVLARKFRHSDVPWHDYRSAAYLAARERVRAVEQQILAVRDAAETARLRARAADQASGFLARLGENEGLAGAEPETLRAITRMIAEEALTSARAAQDAEIEARGIERKLTALEEELQAAMQDLAAVSGATEDRGVLTLDLELEAEGTVEIDIGYLTLEAGWQPVTDLYLTTGASPQVDIRLGARVTQDTGDDWSEIALSISTLRPMDRASPSTLWPLLRRIVEPEREERMFKGAMAEAVVEAPVIVDEFQPAYDVPGTGQTYTLSAPVTLISGVEDTFLEIGRVSEAAEVFAQAAAQHDSHAFRMARFRNSTGRTILPSDSGRRFVDGVMVALEATPQIVEGEEVTLGFGPIYGLTVERAVLNRSTGDTGIITRSNAQNERVEIAVRNLTGESWPLRVFDQVPYSEQEDLVIDWTATPKPDEQDVDRLRGILAWKMELAPEAERIIRLDTAINWPEGMELR